MIDSAGDSISAAAVSPDGERVALIGYNGSLAIWSLLPLHRLVRWSNAIPAPIAFRAGVSAVRFSPSGNLVAFSMNDGHVSVWSVPRGQLLDLEPTPKGTIRQQPSVCPPSMRDCRPSEMRFANHISGALEFLDESTLLTFAGLSWFKRYALADATRPDSFRIVRADGRPDQILDLANAGTSLLLAGTTGVVRAVNARTWEPLWETTPIQGSQAFVMTTGSTYLHYRNSDSLEVGSTVSGAVRCVLGGKFPRTPVFSRTGMQAAYLQNGDILVAELLTCSSTSVSRTGSSVLTVAWFSEDCKAVNALYRNGVVLEKLLPPGWPRPC